MKFLEKIDNYFYAHSKKDLFYMIVIVIFFLFFVFIRFIYPMSKSFRLESEKKYENYLKKISFERIQINSYKFQKMKYVKKFKIVDSELKKMKKQNFFYEELVNLLDFTKFNRQKWASYIKKFIFIAKEDGLKIENIKNDIIKHNKKNNTLLEKKMSLEMNLRGSYKNFIYYIYKFENLKDLIKVENIKITKPNKFFIKFAIYGLKK